ncbi:MAG: hypothetical protein PHP43_03370 [Methanoculleus sp.]|nr:hypothetical protein [Methanoculleus sp.]
MDAHFRNHLVLELRPIGRSFLTALMLLPLAPFGAHTAYHHAENDCRNARRSTGTGA